MKEAASWKFPKAAHRSRLRSRDMALPRSTGSINQTSTKLARAIIIVLAILKNTCKVDIVGSPDRQCADYRRFELQRRVGDPEGAVNSSSGDRLRHGSFKPCRFRP